ncbi:MAG: FAD-dependent oxidoreductase [Pseudomonadota bacterium]
MPGQKDGRKMIVSGNDFVPSATERHFDVAVVGAGTVGLCLATALRRKGVSVIVLEAGGASANTTSNVDTAVSAGHPHEGTDLGRASGLGGTSALWAGQLVEFDPLDLRRHDRPWPINYEILQPWYNEAYAFLGLGPRPTVAQYQEAMGFRIKANARVEPLMTRWLPEPNFTRLFARDLQSDMPVVTDVEVDRIEFEGTRATSVNARSKAGASVRVAADHVILAAGTIGNARLALALQRQKGCPWTKNTFVGRYFLDHLGGAVATVEVLDDTAFRKAFEHGQAFGQKFEPKLKFTEEASAQKILGVNGAFLFHSALYPHLSNLKQTARAARNGVLHSNAWALPGDLVRIGRSFLPLVCRYLRDRRVYGFYDRGIEFYVQSEQIPLFHSSVRLEPGSQNERLPKAVVDWQVDGREIDAIRHFVESANALLVQQGLARIIPKPELDSRQGGLSLLADTYHQSGGMRMSAAAGGGVTDADGLIWNTRNVYVAGASVMPSSSHANVTLTSMALALRLAAHLTAKVKGRALAPISDTM